MKTYVVPFGDAREWEGDLPVLAVGQHLKLDGQVSVVEKTWISLRRPDVVGTREEVLQPLAVQFAVLKEPEKD